MTTHEELSLYIKQISRGLLNISLENTSRIIEIANKSGKIEVKKLRYNGANNIYEPYISFHLDENDVKAILDKYKGLKQYEGFYKYQIPALGVELKTINPNLFG